MSNITINKAYYDKLKKGYNTAVKEKQESFKVEEDEYQTYYAKYILEYLNPKFEKIK